jgi:hypothetical protein
MKEIQKERNPWLLVRLTTLNKQLTLFLSNEKQEKFNGINSLKIKVNCREIAAEAVVIVAK